MKNFLKTLLFLTLANNGYAALYFCDNQEISRVEVQASRDDNHAYENKLIIRLTGSCNEKSAFYIEKESPMYDSILSLALAAKMGGKKIWLHVNTSKVISGAMQIAIIGIEE